MSEEILWTLKKQDSGKVYKNLPFATLKAWILEARIDPNDRLANSKTKKWMQANKVKELAPYFAPEAMGSDVISSGDMGFGWGKDSEEDLTVDMTPMIDITFLLLIFFMVTATFAVQKGMQISVPKAKNVQEHRDKKLEISIYADRRIFINKDRVELSELKDSLAVRVTNTLQQDIIVAGEPGVDYEYVIQVLDEVKGAGIKDIKLKLEKK